MFDDAQYLDSILQPDESIVWEGEPIDSSGSAYGQVVVGALGLAFFAMMLAANVERGRDGRIEPSARLQHMSMAAVCFVCLLHGLWRAALPPTLYLLTNRRAVVYTPRLFRRPAIRSFGPGRIFVREQPDGSGDLLFATGLAGGRGFRRIADVRQVESLARATLQPQPNDAHGTMRRLYPTPEADVEDV